MLKLETTEDAEKFGLVEKLKTNYQTYRWVDPYTFQPGVSLKFADGTSCHLLLQVLAEHGIGPVKGIV